MEQNGESFFACPQKTFRDVHIGPHCCCCWHSGASIGTVLGVASADAANQNCSRCGSPLQLPWPIDPEPRCQPSLPSLPALVLWPGLVPSVVLWNNVFMLTSPRAPAPAAMEDMEGCHQGHRGQLDKRRRSHQDGSVDGKQYFACLVQGYFGLECTCSFSLQHLTLLNWSSTRRTWKLPALFSWASSQSLWCRKVP